jgi:hypothetical protein
MIKGAAMLAVPNTGAIFAEWVYAGPAVPAGTVPYATWRQCSDGTTTCANAQIATIIDNNIKSPGLQSIMTSQIATLRTQADNLFKAGQVPFMTVTGDSHAILNLSSISTATVLAISGYILDNVVTPAQCNCGGGGYKNDGLVTVPESKLPSSYAFDDATESWNHLQVGQNSTPLVHGRFDGLEAMITGFKKSSTGGFGSADNTWAWSMRWFNNALYVGTGRDIQCVTLFTAAIKNNNPGKYPGTSGCVPDATHLPLQAEIWRYTAGSGWARVYQSPADIQIKDANGNVVSTAEEMGIRNLFIYTENAGTPQAQQVLYAGGVAAQGMFNGFYVSSPQSFPQYPPPRILRSVDGVNWAALPNPPGTFLGDLAVNGGIPSQTTADIEVVSFRSFENFNGQLHAVVTNLRGEGFVIASDSTPWLGGNHWRRVSPSLTVNFTPHVWALKAFNGWLYAPGGNRSNQTAQTAGYTVYKADGVTLDPANPGMYLWTPVVLFGSFQTAATQVQSPVALTVEISCAPQPTCTPANSMLYIGTNRRTEMIRIHPSTNYAQDTWDLVVGYPRQVPSATGQYPSSYNGCPAPACTVSCTGCPTATGATGDFKRPLSGIMNYFNNTFNAHFWQMKDDGPSGLYMGTYDESMQVQQSSTINPYFNAILGTDLFNSKDGGVTWTQIHYDGFYDGANFGSRSMEKTPVGFFLGTARNSGGTQIWQNATALDLNNDGVIDQKDVNIVTSAAATNAKAAPGDPRDLDGDGKITTADARLLATQCTFAGCASPPPNMLKSSVSSLPSPTGLKAAPGNIPIPAGTQISLTWNAVPGAIRYHVYRMTQKTLSDILHGGGPPQSPTNVSVDIPGVGQMTLQDIINGSLNSYCKTNDVSWCDFLPALQAYNPSNPSSTQNTMVGFPSAPIQVAVVPTASYSETAPTTLQCNYWVKAEDINGNLSPASNLVGAPSLSLN